ncbi:MAG: PAS domain-containing protein [Syntrophomonadaceae bacterium]
MSATSGRRSGKSRSNGRRSSRAGRSPEARGRKAAPADSFHAVFDALPIAVLVVDDDGRAVEANLAACRLLGRRRDEIVDRSIARAIGGGLARGSPARREDAPVEGEAQISRPDGSKRLVELRVQATLRPGRHLIVLRDVTARRAFEATVLAQEAYLREGQRFTHTGSWAWEVTTGDLFWSEETYRIAGRDSRTERLSYELFLTMIEPDDLPRVRREIADALEAKGDFESRFRLRRPDGSVRHVHSVARPFLEPDGQKVLRYVGVVMDVTEQDLAAERLRASFEELQSLSQRILIIREEERARIAREVHDEIGQALTALRMDVAWLERRLRNQGGLADKLQAMSSLVDTTIDAVQRIATELRPAVLDELGLEAATEWYVREFEKRTGLVCRFDSALDGALLDRDRSTAVFRILQEALTNVARHSAARRAEVRLVGEGDRLVLEVRDDGRGIAPERIGDLRSLGIAGMRERARAAGGEIEFRPGLAGGTVVRLDLPL